MSAGPPDATERHGLPRRRERKAASDDVAYVIAIWFGCGLAPKAPGTVGTLGALPLYWALVHAGAEWVAVSAALLTFIGVWSAASTARQLNTHDPGLVVIDEVAGVLTALSFAPFTPVGVITAVLLFRLLDIWKPGPVRYLERNLPGGWGIVMDDILAGAIAGGLTWATCRLIAG